jgi:hypothetical protein
MIVRIFDGCDWAGAVERGDFDFDEVPRFGEALAIGDDDRWYAGRVLDVVHRLADGGAADVALLMAEVREGPRGNEALPLALLDDTAGGGQPPSGAPEPSPKPGPWS